MRNYAFVGVDLKTIAKVRCVARVNAQSLSPVALVLPGPAPSPTWCLRCNGCGGTPALCRCLQASLARAEAVLGQTVRFDMSMLGGGGGHDPGHSDSQVESGLNGACVGGLRVRVDPSVSSAPVSDRQSGVQCWHCVLQGKG
jgi:hypothetical protein